MGITPLPFGWNGSTTHKCFLLMKSLGDWTRSLNERARVAGLLDDTTFYMSRIKPPNFTQGLFNWNRVFILATGAGIAPLIPYVVHTDYLKIAISLVWVARDHANNYPKFIVDLLEPLPDVMCYDTHEDAAAQFVQHDSGESAGVWRRGRVHCQQSAHGLLCEQLCPQARH
eukprot:UN03601